MTVAFRDECLTYLGERTSRIEYRFPRYAAVADELFAYGLSDTSIILDVGAGMGDFDFYLRAVRGFKGRYLPVDGSIDGTDLNRWTPPPVLFDFVVALEVLEHVYAPRRLLEQLFGLTFRALVLTTPNTDILGDEAVRLMDRTHVSPIYADMLRTMGMIVHERSFFGQPRDSLLAVRYFNH